MLAAPTTRENRTIGTTIIFSNLMKRSPRGFNTVIINIIINLFFYKCTNIFDKYQIQMYLIF